MIIRYNKMNCYSRRERRRGSKTMHLKLHKAERDVGQTYQLSEYNVHIDPL